MIFGFYFGLAVAITLVFKTLNLDRQLSQQLFHLYQKLPLHLKRAYKSIFMLVTFPVLFGYIFNALGNLGSVLSISGNPPFDIIRGLSPLVTSCIAIYIAYQQYQINKLNLYTNLYNKRFTLYKSIINVLSEASKKDESSLRQFRSDYIQGKVLDFLNLKREANFIFNDKEINDRLDKIHDCLERWQNYLEIEEEIREGKFKESSAILTAALYPFDLSYTLDELGSEKSMETLFEPYLLIKANKNL